MCADGVGLGTVGATVGREVKGEQNFTFSQFCAPHAAVFKLETGGQENGKPGYGTITCFSGFGGFKHQGTGFRSISYPRTAGFKLDTLLKLSDVKGVDRKTSLLQFVVASMLKRHGGEDGAGIATLSRQLASIKPAANLQARESIRCRTVQSTYAALQGGHSRFGGP